LPEKPYAVATMGLLFEPAPHSTDVYIVVYMLRLPSDNVTYNSMN
jgi:hypothetical protein